MDSNTKLQSIRPELTVFYQTEAYHCFFLNQIANRMRPIDYCFWLTRCTNCLTPLQVLEVVIYMYIPKSNFNIPSPTKKKISSNLAIHIVQTEHCIIVILNTCTYQISPFKVSINNVVTFCSKQQSLQVA